MKKNLYTLVIAFIFVFGLAFISSYCSSVGSWYDNLNKSELSPPGVVFSIVWTILYTMIALSFWLFMRKVTKDQIYITGWVSFLLQMFLQASWPYYFFQLHFECASVFLIVLVILAVMWNIWAFYKASKLSALLLVPYLLWLCFATYLNSAICALN